MPRIPDEEIERIREATDIIDVVSEHVQLTRKGTSNYFGLCPFHEEKTPSFSVNADRQIYHCFGCGAGGNVFRFLQEMEGISFVEAVKILAERAGLPPPTAGSRPQAANVSDDLFRANELAKKYFHHILHKDERGRDAAAYLDSRGLSQETIELFGLGYAPPGWDNLLQVAERRGLSATVLEHAGLAQARQRGSGHYDRFRDRVTFPIAGTSGRIVGFGARGLRPDEEPKYLNSPETAIYHKGSVLYGLDHTRTAIREANEALVVEGYMDLLSLHQHGVTNVVATSGTALTQQQCRLLARAAERVVLLFDGDAAGSAAAIRGAQALVAAGLNARVASLPPEHDPDSFVKANGAAALRDLLDHAPDALAFHLDRVSAQHDLHTVQGRAHAMDACKPLLLSVTDPVRRDLLLREVAQRLRIDERAVREELRQEARRHSRVRGTTRGPAKSEQYAPPRPEKTFLGLLLNYPRWIAPTAAQLSPEAFTDATCRRVATLLFEQYQDAADVDVARLITRLDDEEAMRLVSECAMEGFEDSQVERQWEDYLRHLRVQRLTREIDAAREKLEKAVSASDEEEATRVNRRLIELNQQRQQLLAEQSP